MMKYLFILLSLFASLQLQAQALRIPIGGNTWQYSDGALGRDLLRSNSIKGWDQTTVSFQTFVRFSKTGNIKLSLQLEAVNDGGTFEVSIGQQKRIVKIKSSAATTIALGKWFVRDTGYQVIKLKALKLGKSSPVILAYQLESGMVEADLHYVKNNEGNFYYWGRRGPSVHLGYNQPQNESIEWYYNEVTVPVGNDIEGSYYMANGFGEGYFGMQVNGPQERRILFSVWSPFSTDDPKAIPEDHKILLKAKGEKVQTGEFGNEGSGGQSFLRYNWKAGNTYKFLLRGHPIADGYTEYTAWFFIPEEDKWQLIATFQRPKTQTYLKGFHSFLENFNPNQGIYERQVLFGNQWVRTAGGKWIEATKARFTADNTARQGYRMDYAGGLNGNQFYLRNCGFFSDYTKIMTNFERKPTNVEPAINFESLEK
ncbi:DUF3472 domain-containing protein [Rhinopithecimicrobium faecis]